MIEDVLGLIFAAISAVCAIIGTLRCNDTKDIKDEIEEERDRLIRINELMNIVNPCIDKLEMLKGDFAKYSCSTLSKGGNREKELKDYGKIKMALMGIESSLSNDTKIIKLSCKAVHKLIDTLDYCIHNERTLSEHRVLFEAEVSKGSTELPDYSYRYIDSIFVDIIKGLKSLQQSDMYNEKK